jgi:hypothetical protein
MILGAAKSGTTSLAYYLSQHPQIYLSEPKEPHFFELEYAQGMAFYWSTYFGGWAGEPWVGEASPVNLLLPYVPARIRKELPEVKLLAILRHPVERAFSAWWMRHSLGVEKLSFEDAIAANLDQEAADFSIHTLDEERWREVKHWAQDPPQVKYRWYVEQGYYAEQISRYLDLFPRAQLRTLFFEDLVGDPASLVRAVLSFLGADTAFDLPDSRPQMTATPAVGAPLLRVARRLGVHALIPAFLRRWLRRTLRRINTKPAMPPALRHQLVEHYSPHNRQLEELTGRDLSCWDG